MIYLIRLTHSTNRLWYIQLFSLLSQKKLFFNLTKKTHFVLQFSKLLKVPNLSIEVKKCILW